MATLTRFDDEMIAFRKVGDERVDYLIVTGIGILFAGISIPLLVQSQTWGPRMLLVVAIALVGSALIGYAFVPLFKSERLVVDLDRRKYQCRRGVFFWGERLRGPVTDFNQIRLTLVPYPGGHSCWAVEVVWRDDGHPPFRVQHWRRARSFSRAHAGDDNSQISFLNDLKRMAKNLDVPLVVPREYCVNLGLLDAETDLGQCAHEHNSAV